MVRAGQCGNEFDEICRFRFDRDISPGEHAMSAGGLITLHSSFGSKEAMSRLEAESAC
jgi:hypothetical protein